MCHYARKASVFISSMWRDSLRLCPPLSPAEAQEETIEQKFARFSEQMSEMSRAVAEKVKTTFDELHNSEFATSSR